DGRAGWISVKSIVRTSKRMAQHILRPLLYVRPFHRSSSQFLKVARRYGTGPAGVRLKPREEIIGNFGKSFLPRFCCACIDADCTLLEIQIIPSEFVNFLRPQPCKRANR